MNKWDVFLKNALLVTLVCVVILHISFKSLSLMLPELSSIGNEGFVIDHFSYRKLLGISFTPARLISMFKESLESEKACRYY